MASICSPPPAGVFLPFSPLQFLPASSPGELGVAQRLLEASHCAKFSLQSHAQPLQDCSPGKASYIWRCGLCCTWRPWRLFQCALCITECCSSWRGARCLSCHWNQRSSSGRRCCGEMLPAKILPASGERHVHSKWQDLPLSLQPRHSSAAQPHPLHDFFYSGRSSFCFCSCCQWRTRRRGEWGSWGKGHT